MWPQCDIDKIPHVFETAVCLRPHENMSSVRARIEDIEAKNRSTEDGETKNDLNDVKSEHLLV